MCSNKHLLLILVFLTTLSPGMLVAQEIKGDTIYTSTTQQTVLNFPSNITNIDYSEKSAYASFDTIVEKTLVSLRAKTKNPLPAVINITEGNRTHSFIIAYKDELNYDELHHQWSDLNDLNKYVPGYDKKNSSNQLKIKKQNTGAKNTDAQISSSAVATKSGEADYNDLYLQSYDLLEKKDFVEAKKLFEQANFLKDKKFNEELIRANKFFSAKNYEEAKITYLLALSVKPEDVFAKKRLKESQKMLQAPVPAVTERFVKDKVSENKKADTAMGAAIKPRQVPIVKKQEEKIKSDTVRVEEKKQFQEVAKENEVDKKYDSVVAKATELFNNKAYNDALSYYRQAGLLKPKEDLPPKMIRFVKNVLANLPEEMERDQDLRRKARIIEIKNLGNEAVLNKNWQTAKQLYSEMLTLKPVAGDEEFARKKIETIDIELARIASIPKVQKAPEVVASSPKNRREARAQRILAERSAILASASPANQPTGTAETNAPASIEYAGETKKSSNSGRVKTAETGANKISVLTLNQFKTDFGNVDSVRWIAYPNFSEVSFVQDEDKVEAFYDQNNTLLGKSRNIRPSRIPSVAKKNFVKNYPAYTITEAIAYEEAEQITYYISAEDGKEKVILKAAPDNNYKLQPVKSFLVKSADNISANNKATENENGTVKELMDRRTVKGKNSNNGQDARKLYEQVLSLQPGNETGGFAEKKIERIQPQKPKADLGNQKSPKESLNKKEATKVVVAEKTAELHSEIPVISKAVMVEHEKPAEVVIIKKRQSTAIPYAREELTDRYPGVNFDEMPSGQVYDTADRRNRAMHYEMCKKVLSEVPQLNLADSNNSVKLICQDIIFNGKNAYVKLLIQNKSTTTDFLTGAMQISFLKSNGVVQKLNPRFVSDFPVVMPQKEFSVVYVADAFLDVDPNDMFYLEMSDRMQKNKLTILIPGKIYLRQKPL